MFHKHHLHVCTMFADEQADERSHNRKLQSALRLRSSVTQVLRALVSFLSQLSIARGEKIALITGK